MPTGAELIAAERDRQIHVEGWTAAHDAQHSGGELAAAAKCYLSSRAGTQFLTSAPGQWPWAHSWWKPSTDRVRNLVKAGALIAAEIDRLQAAPMDLLMEKPR